MGWAGLALRTHWLHPGSYSLQVSPEGSAATEPQAFDFEANTTYTLYLIGSPGGDPAVSILNMIAPRNSARVRFVNERSDTVDIHYRPGNDRIAESLASGATSDFTQIAARAITFVAYAPGTGPTGQELAALPIQLRPGRDLTITLTNNGMSVTERVLNP